MRTVPSISQRALALEPSLTLAISSRAKALKEDGRDICSLSAGEPDFDTPDFILNAAIKALKDGRTRYGPAAGDPLLREAISDKLIEENKIGTSPEEILVTNGGKQAIYNLFQVILDPGDEVIIPSPYWLSYPEMVKLTGAKPIIIEGKSEDGFKIDLEKLEDSINPKTKLLIINTPSNPTGRVIQKDELELIAEIIRRHPRLLVMTDEIYEYLIEEKEIHYSFASIAPDLINRTFTVNGFAKGWAMTGWRIGYLCGNKHVLNAAIALQSQSTSNVCSFAQRGALAALKGPRNVIKDMVNSYNSRRKLITNSLKNIKGISLVEPRGAFYAFPKLPTGSLDSMSFCKLALEKYNLAMIPGIAFGNDSCIRVSCSVSSETITEGIKRLNLAIIENIN